MGSAVIMAVQDWIWDVLNNGKSKMRPTPFTSIIFQGGAQAIIHIHSIYQDNNMEPSNKNAGQTIELILKWT